MAVILQTEDRIHNLKYIYGMNQTAMKSIVVGKRNNHIYFHIP